MQVFTLSTTSYSGRPATKKGVLKLGKERQKIALLSVYDKRGIVEFARWLVNVRGYIIWSSGGTAKKIREAGIPVTDTAEITHHGALLDHRVATLWGRIHGGLMAKFNPKHTAEMRKLHWDYVDLVCVDVYPLEEAIAMGKTWDEIIDMIDIGGPTMLSSGAKGERISLCEQSQRASYMAWEDAGRPNEQAQIRYWNAKADAYVATYRLTSARYRGPFEGIIGEKVSDCCYDENKRSGACLYTTGSDDPLALGRFVKAEESMMDPSYVNWCDMHSALTTLCHATDAFRRAGITPFMAFGVKHGNACGAGYATTSEQALKNMIVGDRKAILGGMVITNFVFEEKHAEILLHWRNLPGEKRRLIDCLAVPAITPGAIALMERRKGKCRVMINPALDSPAVTMETDKQIRPVRGGFLMQDPMPLIVDPLSDPEYLICGKITARQLRDGLFAWAIASTSVSNTFTLVKNGRLIGNGCGRQSRVDACRLAIQLAVQNGHDTANSTGWSDSYFPKDDGPRLLVKAGVKTIFTTSGSQSDEQIFAYFQSQPGLTVVAIPDKIARGFCRH